MKESLETWREGAKENALQMDDAELMLAEKEHQLETARSNAAILRNQVKIAKKKSTT